MFHDYLSRFSEVEFRKALIERELIEERVDGVFLSDAVFEKWFNREINK